MQLEYTEKTGPVEYRLYIEAEDTPVRGNAMASGDDAHDRAVEDGIFEDLENGNQWAWCVVTVEAHAGGLIGRDTLGGCSYASREDFTVDGGYWPDMKAQALEDLKSQIRESQAVVVEVLAL